MLKETEQDAINNAMNKLWAIFASLIISLFMYIFIGHVAIDEVRNSLSPEASEIPLKTLQNILYGVSVLIFILSYFLRKFMLGMKQTGAFAEVASKYTAAVMISLALSEVIAIFGLVLFFLGADNQTLYTFVAVSALLMFFYRPKRAELEALALTRQPQPTI